MSWSRTPGSLAAAGNIGGAVCPGSLATAGNIGGAVCPGSLATSSKIDGVCASWLYSNIK